MGQWLLIDPMIRPYQMGTQPPDSKIDPWIAYLCHWKKSRRPNRHTYSNGSAAAGAKKKLFCHHPDHIVLKGVFAWIKYGIARPKGLRSIYAHKQYARWKTTQLRSRELVDLFARSMIISINCNQRVWPPTHSASSHYGVRRSQYNPTNRPDQRSSEVTVGEVSGGPANHLDTESPLPTAKRTRTR